jgi:hypothetical protein
MTGRLQVLGFEGRAEEEKGIEEEKWENPVLVWRKSWEVLEKRVEWTSDRAIATLCWKKEEQRWWNENPRLKWTVDDLDKRSGLGLCFFIFILLETTCSLVMNDSSYLS